MYQTLIPSILFHFNMPFLLVNLHQDIKKRKIKVVRFVLDRWRDMFLSLIFLSPNKI